MAKRGLRSWLALGGIAGLLVPTLAVGAELKIGFVDQRGAILTSTEGREAERVLRELATEKQQEIAPREEELRRLGAELEAQRYVLTPQAIEERRLDLVKKRNDLERAVQEVQEELQLVERKLLAPLVKRFGEAVQEIGKKEDLSLILDRSSPGVLYLEDGLDITERVVEHLNHNGSQ